ncbi:MAG TPA: hypothetical protein VFP10_12595, partial [Candidatus Eisenbacteria bacterium]|nr:hypothetical protein [Candidatus Eisenbacteria bacterium]
MTLLPGRIFAFFTGRKRGRATRGSMSLRARTQGLPSQIDLRPTFTSILVAGGVRQFSIRAEHPQITQLLLDAVRALPGPLGVAIVELGEPTREWVGTGASRPEVLEAILAMRDLLGRGSLDVAVFSGHEGVEIYLDRAGILELRVQGSWEPRARSLLETGGFMWTARLTPA